MIDVSQIPPEGLDVKVRIVKRGPIWMMWRDPTRRCPTCYLPMAYSFAWDNHRCELCGRGITGEADFDRPRWRRWLDRLMGMHF